MLSAPHLLFFTLQKLLAFCHFQFRQMSDMLPIRYFNPTAMRNRIFNEWERLLTALPLCFSLPHPTCKNANLSIAKGEQADDVTYLRVESETEIDEELNRFWQQRSPLLNCRNCSKFPNQLHKAFATSQWERNLIWFLNSPIPRETYHQESHSKEVLSM